MNKVVSLKEIPSNSIIREGFGKVDYFDSYRVTKSTHLSIDKIATAVFRLSGIGVILMKIRDIIVRPFGLAASGNEAPEQDYYPPGSRLMIFTVSARSENEIVMEENDKHLKFRTSLLMDGGQLYLTTLVRYNHWLGKLYFIPVKPFHRMLIKSQLKKTSAVIS